MKDEASPKKIAFLTSLDPQDKRSWSGTIYQMAQALQRHGGEVIYIYPASSAGKKHEQGWRKQVKATVKRFVHKYCGFAYRCFFFARQYFIHDYHVKVARGHARTANQRLMQESFDVIVAPSTIEQVAFLETEIPIVIVEDATFAVLINYNRFYTHLLPTTIHKLNTVMETGMRKASALVYSSRWAAQSALDDYQADPAKVHVVPMGANFDDPPTKEMIQQKRKSPFCKLLFVGVNWPEKGGEIAFETLLALEKMGIMAELTICGCVPPSRFVHSRLTVIPFLDKNDPKQSEQLAHLFMMADFFLLPTRNECFGMSMCEAHAFGLPVITTATGGLPEVIEEGENGFLLPLAARGDEYAKVIAKIYQDDQRYSEMVRSSRAAFDERLNWDAWAITMNEIISELLAGKKRSKEYSGAHIINK